MQNLHHKSVLHTETHYIGHTNLRNSYVCGFVVTSRKLVKSQVIASSLLSLCYNVGFRGCSNIV